MNTSGDWSERFQFKPWYPRYLRFTGAIDGVPLAHKIIHKGLSTKQLPTKELLLETALAGLNAEEWHLHRFRDTAATRWLRAGIDVRTVQSWLGHESLATTQKYLEPSRDTEKALSRMKLPF